MKFLKSFFSIMGIHLAMCIVPFLLMPILSNDPRYTLNMPKSAGQIIGYALYFILFFAAYFWIGRTAGDKIPSNRLNVGGVVARILSTILIVAAGIYVYYGVIVPQDLGMSFMSFFAMPQLMIKKAITDEVIGNKIFSTVVITMPGILIFAGYI